MVGVFFKGVRARGFRGKDLRVFYLYWFFVLWMRGFCCSCIFFFCGLLLSIIVFLAFC